MLRASSLVLVFALAGCAFAQKHPAVTAGIVAGSIGFTTCFIAVEKPGTCGIVGGVAGGGIGGIAGIATTVFEPNAPPEPDEQDQGMMRRVQGEGEPEGPYLPPAPNPLPATALPDAGVPMAPALPDAGVPMAPAPDATVAPADASSAD